MIRDCNAYPAFDGQHLRQLQRHPEPIPRLARFLQIGPKPRRRPLIVRLEIEAAHILIKESLQHVLPQRIFANVGRPAVGPIDPGHRVQRRSIHKPAPFQAGAGLKPAVKIRLVQAITGAVGMLRI